MNTFIDETPDGLAIAKLVDGTLSEEARRSLLLQLDRAPGGWRACALAFLEEQAFRTALAPLGRSLVADATVAGDVSGPALEMARRGLTKLLPLAWAASVLLALSAGWFGGRSGSPRTPSGGETPLIAKNQETNHQQPRRDPETSPVENREPVPPAPLVADSKVPNRKDTGLPGGIVPAVSVGPTDLTALPPDVRARLERRGYQVEHRFGVAAVPVGKDRRVALPVEEFKVRYVGYRTY